MLGARQGIELKVKDFKVFEIRNCLNWATNHNGIKRTERRNGGYEAFA